MATCSKCGFRIPEGAVFCPNCGAPVKRVEEHIVPSGRIGNLIRLGLLGTLLSFSITYLIVSLAGSIELYFMPSFLSALVVIYFSRTKNLKDAIIVAAAVYLFTEAIFNGLFLGTLLAMRQSIDSYYAEYYRNYVPTVVDVLMYSISPITAIIAGYIGSKIAPKGREEVYGYPGESGIGPTLSCNVRVKDAFKKFKLILSALNTS
jgi:hypothetical protein